jgi:hypothetical protein
MSEDADISDDSSSLGRPNLGGIDASRGVSIRKIFLRVVLMAVVFVGVGFLLYYAFDDLDLQSILDAVRGLEDAEILALIGTTAIVIFAESLLTASVVNGMPARRGALAWLGPNAVGSVVPGPSDMPVRYRMFVSWDYTPSVAGTAVAASGLLNIANKLILPVIAAIGLAVGDIPLEGVASTIVTAAVILGVLVVVSGVVLGSESRTEAMGRFIDRIWGATMRLLRRSPSGPDLANRLVVQRARSLEVLHGRWVRAVASITFVTVVRVALFVMCIRFAGVPESAASWQAIFCVWAIVLGLTVIPLMPGNAGVSELAYVGLLTPIAGEQYVNQVTAGVLIFRILTWLAMIPIGAGAIGIWRYSLGKAGPDTPPASAVS